MPATLPGKQGPSTARQPRPDKPSRSTEEMQMPVEIKELHIRVAVNAAPANQAPAAQNASGGSGNAGDKDAIVAECAEQVLQIMQTKKER